MSASNKVADTTPSALAQYASIQDDPLIREAIPCVSTYHWTASVRDNIDLRARLRPGRCPSPHTQR